MKWTKLITRDANVLLKSLVIKGISHGPKFVFPDWSGFKNHFWIWDNSETQINYLTHELEQWRTFLLKKIEQNPQLIQDYINKSKDICINGANNVERSARNISTQSTKEELLRAFNQFCEQFASLSHTIVMTLVPIQEKLIPIIEQQVKDIPASQILTTLVAPNQLSIEAQEELSRLKILEHINSKEEYQTLFSKDITSIKQEVKQHKELHQIITQHTTNFCWIPLNFEKELWDADFFIRNIKIYYDQNFDYKLRIEELTNHEQQREKEKAELFQRLQLNPQQKHIIELLHATSYIRLFRATMYSKVFYNGFPILKEIAKRTKVSFQALTFHTYQEIHHALSSNELLDETKALQRKQSFAILIENNNYQQFEAEHAQKIIQQETPTQIIETKNVTTIKGMCAYPGNVVGKVKIVFDARQIDHINKGDILVCKETNPDLVIIMEKAGAIITDEGGLTSHAAIVSREMKKPCIIGTKHATKILKDNMNVEVDAAKGTIKILED